MNTQVHDTQRSGTWASTMNWWRRDAWLIILIADAGLLLWGALAALIPTSLPGPGGAAILPAGYERTRADRGSTSRRRRPKGPVRRSSGPKTSVSARTPTG